MPYRWNPGWSGPVLVAFFVFSSALALIIRRKWKLAEIRRAEVVRLVRLAAAEAEMAEKEAASVMYEAEKPFPAFAGWGIGNPNCAVCQSPTTTRCSRCKAVRYCSGNCQITHWRQGHKYECHPPPIKDHYSDLSNVQAMKGVHTEKSEISGNNLGVTSDDFYVQSEPSIFVESSSEIEVKQGDAKSLETSSTVSASSEIHSENAEDREKHFINSSGPGEIPDSSSSKDRFTRGASGHHSNTNAHDDTGESPSSSQFTRAASGHHSNTNTHDDIGESSSSGGSSERPTISQIVSDQANLPTFAHAATIAGSARHSSSSSDLKLYSTQEFKLNSHSNVSFSSHNHSKDTRLYEDVREFRPIGLSSNIPGKSNASLSSEGDFDGRRETLDSNAVETVICADSTVTQSFNRIHQPQLDRRFHSDSINNFPGKISVSAAANHGRSDFKEAGVSKKSGEVSREGDNEQLKSSSHASRSDHSASVSHGQSFLRHGSPKVENVLPVCNKSLKVDGSVQNGKISSKRTVQLVPSASLLRRSHSGLSNKGYEKFNYKTLFPYDNFIRLYSSDKVEMHPCGLVNCGNSCYANAVLQCLAFTRPLAAYILEGLHAKTCPKKGWCFTCEFEALLIKAKHGKSPVSPTGIISHIHDIGSNFGQGREEDAHEFLRYSIDAMQSTCLKEAGASAVSELTEETTLIQLIFGGYLRSKIKCMRCQGKSERRERMMDLTVDIHGDIGTLEEALARYTTSEILEGENKYRCDRCKSFERAKKQLTILEAPNVLTIALKRYQSGKYGKLNKTVHFPEYLNLAPYMRGSDDNSPVYRLYAVVVHNCHMNATFSGHYVCFVKNTQGKWFKADDSMVKEVDVQKVLSQGAYMLLYARVSPRAPSLLRREMTKNAKSKEHEHAHTSSTRPRFTSFLPGTNIGHGHAGRTGDHPSNFEPRDPFDERFRRPPKGDSSSDCSSLFSCSDEGSSWSTESGKDSVTSDEFGCSSFSELGYSDSISSEEGGFRERESTSVLYSVKHYKNLAEQRSSGKSGGGWWVSSGEQKPSVLFRRSSGDRGAQTFY
ncbi:Ubiquitin carboxyl-terminal hydrolase 16 [Platanthera zijinensis]|uniref:ubiquitinyl hydrolase 1 n=1 Tax=Platanthera zijinensis TaxID=2320716 RepID=A0AAP0BVZ4_9ASPA